MSSSYSCIIMSTFFYFLLFQLKIINIVVVVVLLYQLMNSLFSYSATFFKSKSILHFTARIKLFFILLHIIMYFFSIFSRFLNGYMVHLHIII